VDEEGGEVTRVSSFEQYRSEPFLSPQEAFVWDGWEEIRAQEQEKALLLKELGLNMNLAPVADVPLEETDFIYSRAFSMDPNEVAEFVKTAVKLSQDEKVASVIKHFPGYGNNMDTHTGIAYDERDFQTFIERDFLPFQAGIEAGASAVLVAHNVITSVDETMPASLSPEVNQLLRENLSFDGIVMTDDLIMDGLRLFAETEEAAVLAVLAGNDILISSEFPAQVSAVISAVEEGRIAEEQINEAVLRILKIKLQLEIIE
ncbi:MAG TPA: beta-hexosaminidase, partial [Candidatus Jeotgalibaca pullicola]|nr:beta-hexosaminidase [Candidatus Jeotgalibaca pullicola]